MRFAGDWGYVLHRNVCHDPPSVLPSGTQRDKSWTPDFGGRNRKNRSANLSMATNWKCTRRLFGSVIRPVCCESCRSNTVHLPSDSPAFDRLLLSKGAIRMSDMSWLSFNVNIYYHNGVFLSITFLKNVTIFSEKIRRQKEFLLNS